MELQIISKNGTVLWFLQAIQGGQKVFKWRLGVYDTPES